MRKQDMLNLVSDYPRAPAAQHHARILSINNIECKFAILL